MTADNMSAAPERIWAFNSKQTGYRFYANGPQPEFDNVEYVRADLAALPAVAPALMDELVEAVKRLNAACDAMWNDHQRLEENLGRFGQKYRIKEVHVKAITEAQQQLPAVLAKIEGA